MSKLGGEHRSIEEREADHFAACLLAPKKIVIEQFALRFDTRKPFPMTEATLFAIGHSATLLLGVLADIHANAHIVDAIIGLSVVYKAMENIGVFQRLGLPIDTRAAVLLFGLAHGLGLSTKLQDLVLSPDGLVGNILAFNVGVEIGQVLALMLMLLAFHFWRRNRSFVSSAYLANGAIMAAGFVLFGYQMGGYIWAT